MMTERKLIGCQVFWDESDPNNVGWAERAYFDDGHEESGPCGLLDPEQDSVAEMRDAVIGLAWQYGVGISAGMVAVDGMCAEFSID